MQNSQLHAPRTTSRRGFPAPVFGQASLQQPAYYPTRTSSTAPALTAAVTPGPFGAGTPFIPSETTGFITYSPPLETATIEGVSFRPDAEASIVLRGLRTPAAPNFLGAMAAADRGRRFAIKFGPGYVLHVSQRPRVDDSIYQSPGLDLELEVAFEAGASAARLFPLAAEVKLESMTGVVYAERTFDIRHNGAHALHGLGEPADIPAVDALRVRIAISLGAKVAHVPGKSLTLKVFRSIVMGEDLVDTKFVVFSKRRYGQEDGRVGAEAPRAVYASSALLAPLSDYLSTLLSNNGFSESRMQDLEQNNVTDFIDDYDYASDSDLESAAGDEPASPPVSSLSLELKNLGVSDDDSSPERPSVRGKPGFSPIDEEDPSSSPSTSTIIPSRTPTALASRTPTAFGVPTLKPLPSAPAPGPFAPERRTGKVVLIRDTAFATWRALILYLYTSQIMFAPLRSHPSAVESTNTEDDNHEAPPLASAKSIYRLADKIGMDELAILALRHIESQITEENVLHELFSEFSSWYPTIRKMQLEFAFAHWGKLKGSRQLREKLAQVARGELTHAADLLVELVAR